MSLEVYEVPEGKGGFIRGLRLEVTRDFMKDPSVSPVPHPDPLLSWNSPLSLPSYMSVDTPQYLGLGLHTHRQWLREVVPPVLPRESG